MTVRVREGHVLDVLRSLGSDIFQCVATSPPYYGLRDYGLPQQVWGDGWLGSLGLEPEPSLYVEHLVSVFREVRRVLRPDGCIFVNLGDSYAGSALSGLKPKDLLGMPWMVAFALRADGWYLRAEIIWSKPSPMPESVTDRPTKAHETVFLLSKQRTYFYNADAIREEGTSDEADGRRGSGSLSARSRISGGLAIGSATHMAVPSAGRNKRSVWEIATVPFPSAHFAVFPPKLVEPMLLAGTSEKGCCPECGAPWARVAGRPCKACGDFIPFQGKSCPSCGHVNDWKAERGISEAFGTTDWSTAGRATPRKLGASGKQGAVPSQIRLHGEWGPTCAHDAAPVPCQVLDPFGGAGTTGLVADRLGRDCTLIELNPEYASMARERIASDAPLFVDVA